MDDAAFYKHHISGKSIKEIGEWSHTASELTLAPCLRHMHVLMKRERKQTRYIQRKRKQERRDFTEDLRFLDDEVQVQGDKVVRKRVKIEKLNETIDAIRDLTQ